MESYLIQTSSHPVSSPRYTPRTWPYEHTEPTSVKHVGSSRSCLRTTGQGQPSSMAVLSDTSDHICPFARWPRLARGIRVFTILPSIPTGSVDALSTHLSRLAAMAPSDRHAGSSSGTPEICEVSPVRPVSDSRRPDVCSTAR